MPIEIRITTGGTVPIYRQIIDQIRMAVAQGALVNGELLPSVRSLAERLVINPNTVARAYSELVREGVIESRHGKGAYVAKRRQVYSKAERARRMDQALDALISEVIPLDYSHDQIRRALERKLSQLVRGRQKGGSENE